MSLIPLTGCDTNRLLNASNRLPLELLCEESSDEDEGANFNSDLRRTASASHVHGATAGIASGLIALRKSSTTGVDAAAGLLLCSDAWYRPY